jgi:hypothetical protein
MKLLDRLERRFRRYAVPNVTLGLIILQAGAYVLTLPNPDALANVSLIPNRVLEGEVWRLVTFLVVPPTTYPIFAFFFWYLFYLMGTALENTWGAFRYNVYLLAGCLATVAASFLTPDVPASNAFLEGSVFLAFAHLYPNFELYLFFLLRVKIKWLALIAWIGYFWVMVFGRFWGFGAGPTWSNRLMATASVLNFLLFFSTDIALRIKSGHWRMKQQARRIAERGKPRHVCAVCGITNLTHPHVDFRYCSKCEGARAYCPEHLHDHEHVTSESADCTPRR